MAERGQWRAGDFGEDAVNPSIFPLGWLGWLFRSRVGGNHDPQHTFRRLCTSRHLRDLQYIVLATFLIFAVVSMAFVIGPLARHWPVLKSSVLLKDLPFLSRAKFSFTEVAGTYAAIFTVINWAYQSGSRRMGTVDMFAAEISVICRVCVVIDYATTSTQAADERIRRLVAKPSPNTDGAAGEAHGPALAQPSETKFTSQEDYTQAYDDHAAELAPLDADVVTLTTEFYTYRETMLDLVRAIAVAEAGDRTRYLSREMIYMQYLMYESARNAVSWLIEYEPSRSESLVNILCSELVVYPFLREHYKGDDFRSERLELREDLYCKQVPLLLGKIESTPKDDDDWRRARTTAGELRKRYKDMCRRLGLRPGLSVAA